jgi:ribosomal protein S19
LGAKLNPKCLVAKSADYYFFSRSGLIIPSLSGLRVGVYQGFRFHVFRIRREIVGTRFLELVMTRKLSPNIGLKKSHGYSRKKSSVRKLVDFIVFYWYKINLL